MKNGDMLQTLQIKNIALVESVQIDFSPGFNVVTGETGAGKSIIIGALNLLLGERADKDIIRSGTEQGSIEAVFRLPKTNEINRLLEECGVAECSEGALIIRRMLSTGGAGRQFVNDSPVTARILKSIGDLLVDLHGPHDHQSLLKSDFQLGIIDSFGRHEKMLATYQVVFEERAELLNRQKALQTDGGAAARETDIITFQIKELEEAALNENEETTILGEQKTLANAERILQLTSQAQQALSDDDNSAFDRLAAVQQAAAELARVAGPQASEWQNEALSIAVRIRELARSMNAYAQKIEGDSARLQSLDARIAVYQKLKRKYGASIADMNALLGRLKERALDLANREERLAQINAELARNKTLLDKLGSVLRKKRAENGAKLAKTAQRQLKELGFTHASFSALFAEVEPQRSGMDSVEFVFSPNKGEPEKPLRQIASSGEMSRVMLALKTVLAEEDRIPVLIFDEIDENIGGQTAQTVGKKLAALAEYHQVICITHLPQVAAHGNTQFAVRKEIAGERTISRVAPLDDAGRIEELARMLGGRDSTSVTMRHARELLEQAKR